MKLNCVITDDEPLAIEGIARYINEIDFLENAGECSNPIALDKILQNQAIDLIFLDIQMPLMNGLEYLKLNSRLPMVIITTAYPSYALEGYNFDVVDYLVKPITFSRFYKAVTKARDLHILKQKTLDIDKESLVENPDSFFIKCDNKHERILKSDILYVQALENYVQITTQQGKFMTLLPLKTIEKYLENDRFIKTHKSFLVAIDKVETIENQWVKIQNFTIPVSRNFRESVLKNVLAGALLRKG
jgi:DNA-binding LytR/AlgR family response regulator